MQSNNEITCAEYVISWEIKFLEFNFHRKAVKC